MFNHKHICGETNHRIENIYEDVPLTPDEISIVLSVADNFEYDIDDVIYRLQRQKYIKSMCIRCGKTF